MSDIKMISSDLSIELPARDILPATRIYGQLSVQGKLGERELMLLIPGGPGGNHTVYDAIKDHLFKYADLLAIDLRGCGKSQAARVEDCSLYHHIEDIEAIRQVLKLNKFILLGGSYGSMVALGYGVRYSRYLHQLILLAGAPSYHFLITAQANIRRLGNAEQQASAEKLWQGTFESAEDLAHHQQVTASLDSLYLRQHPDKRPPTRNNIPYNYQLMNYAAKQQFYRYDFRDQLGRIACNTLLISGKDDWVNDPVHIEEMARGIPQATCHLLDNCGHFIWLDQMQKFRDCIDGFMG